VRSYALNEGLVSSTVYCAYQDNRGFMWFGTDAGVSRFDGRTFTGFSLDDGMDFTSVSCLFGDSRGRLWMAGNDGRVGFYDGAHFHHAGTDSALGAAGSEYPFYAIHEDSRQNVWLSTESGEIISIDTMDRVHRYEIPVRELPVHPDFYFTSDDEFWIITEERFYKYESGTFVPLIGPRIRGGRRLAYHYISKGNALYLSDKGLERLINKNYGVIIPEARLPFSGTNCRVYYHSNNDIWMSDGESQVACFHYEKGNYGPYKFFSRDMRALTFYNDGERNTWICTDGNGIRKVSPLYAGTVFYTRTEGLSGYRATTLALDADSAVWVGFNIGTVDRIVQNRVDHFRYDHAGRTGILALVADAGGNVWAFAAKYIVFIRNLRGGRFAPPRIVEPGIPAGESVQRAWRSGDDVYFNTSSMVCRIRPGEAFRYFGLVDAQGKAPPDDIPGTAGNTVFGAGRSLYALSADSVAMLTLEPPMRFPVTGHAFVRDSLLVVATHGEGLLVYRGGTRVQQLTAFESFDLRFINRMVRQDQVFLAATNDGLFRFIIENDKVAVIEHFSTGDGLLSDVVNDVYVDSTRMYVCSDLGLSVLPFNLTRLLEDPPPVYVVGVDASNGPPADATDSLKFRYRNLQLTFRFTAPTFDEPDRLLFQYKITGHQEEWEVTRQNEVSFASLDPGSYIFQLRARKYNSDWSKPQIVKFEVIAPFYGTLWFRLLVANTLIFFLYLFLRDYVARKFKRQLAVYERQQMLEKERNRISKDMHDDLGADLTNIVILSKIARKTIKPQSNQEDAIDKIENAANDVINKMNEIIWALNPSNDSLYNLITYLHRYAKEYMDLYGIRIGVVMPASIPGVMVSAAFRRNVFLVVKEMLHNVVKHAGASETAVTIGIDGDNRRLSVRIIDNGKGFSVDERTGSGNGLLNVRKRMKEIGGDIEIASEPGGGTTIDLWAPYVRN